MGKRNPKRGQKTKLIFDPDERKDFLLGFRKRKMERKVKAQEKMEKKIKQEISTLREQQKERFAQLYSYDTALPEVEHLIQPISVDEVDDDIVTISAMDTSAIAAHVGLVVGPKKAVEDDSVEEEEETNKTTTTEPNSKKDTVKSMKKTLSKQVSKKLNKVKHLSEKKKSKKKKTKKKTIGKRKNRPNSRPH